MLTYLFALVIMTLGAVALGANLPKFMFGFTLAFWLSYLCWFMGHFAYIAATKEQVAKFGIPWSMSMSGEFGFIFALILGLIIGNFFPGLANLMKEAARPELYIKTGIVIMGAGLGIKAAESFGLAIEHHVSGLLRHCRGLPDLLGRRLLYRPEIFQVQP